MPPTFAGGIEILILVKIQLILFFNINQNTLMTNSFLRLCQNILGDTFFDLIIENVYFHPRLSNNLMV